MANLHREKKTSSKYLRQALGALTTQPKRKIEKEEKGALVVAVASGKGE
jgi:hypothetical protein